MADSHEGHSHSHEGHSHGVSSDADRRYLAIALALLVGFMLVEVVVGFIASSLALISDAGHMLTDAGAIALALVTMRLAARPARGAMTFGLKRAEILSAPHRRVRGQGATRSIERAQRTEIENMKAMIARKVGDSAKVDLEPANGSDAEGAATLSPVEPGDEGEG